jgi:prophage tail gpP-like protein
VAGRDRTCDLVDCHYSDEPFEFGTKNGATVLSIVKGICKPFAIDVTVDSTASGATSHVVKQRVYNMAATASDATKLIKYSFYVPPGDSVIGSLYRITRWAKVFMMASTEGGLILTMVGSRTAGKKIEAGINVLKGGLKQSDKERFSVYRVRGYSTSTDNLAHSSEWNWMNGRYPNKNGGKDFTAWPDSETGATRYRPFGLVAEQAVQTDATNSMAKAECQFRVGKSRTFNYTVQGLHDGASTLWEPNTLVYITDPLFGLSEEKLLIESVDYMQTDQGTVTDLTLCSKEKYEAEAEINKIKTVFDEGGK